MCSNTVGRRRAGRRHFVGRRQPARLAARPLCPGAPQASKIQYDKHAWARCYDSCPLFIIPRARDPYIMWIQVLAAAIKRSTGSWTLLFDIMAVGQLSVGLLFARYSSTTPAREILTARRDKALRNAPK